MTKRMLNYEKNYFPKKRALKSWYAQKTTTKKDILKEMEHFTLTDQKKYWKLLGRLDEKETNTTQYVSPKNLSDHYRSLLNSKRTLNIPANSTKLDYPITSTELDKAKIFLNAEKQMA